MIRNSHLKRLFLVDPLLHTAVIRRRFDEEANMQFCDFCENMILGLLQALNLIMRTKK